jgi:hypothetical protein
MEELLGGDVMAERPAVDMPKLTDYQPSRFMLPTSHYDKAKADRAVKFIEMLKHTKGKWAGKRFWLLPWQEQIIRDLFGIVKARRKPAVPDSLHRDWQEEWKVRACCRSCPVPAVCRQRTIRRSLWRCGRSSAGVDRF